MNKLYQSIGITKQSFHQYMERSGRRRNEEIKLLNYIDKIRTSHPTMGIRDMFYIIQPSCMGRDAFEVFCKQEGLGSKRKVNYCRTTDSSGVVRFPNLLMGLQVTRINQVWQSDITYFAIGDKFYYLTFIIDSFTRRIVGHCVSKRLFTEQTTLPAAWQNGKAERINGVIKNNYLQHRSIHSYADLIREVDRSVLLYNSEKPHIELQRKSPLQFEKLYFCNGQKPGGEKSTTELKSTAPEDLTVLRTVDKNPTDLISL